MTARALYLRIPASELARFRARPELVKKLDLRVPLGDGRALDLGRGWDEIGCLLEHGWSTPTRGPTIGEEAIFATDDEAWTALDERRVVACAAELGVLTQQRFEELYAVDDLETVDLPGDASVDRASTMSRSKPDKLWRKVEKLAAHYAAASARGEAMLIRIQRSF